MVKSEQRFRGERECPVCHGRENDPRGRGVRCTGFLSEDSEWAFCSREEHAGNLTPRGNSEAFMHRLAGPCACGIEHGIVMAPVQHEPRPTRREEYEKPRGQIDRCHVYFDEQGKPVHRTVRYRDPKDFRQQRYVFGSWRFGLRDTRLVLYRLPELLKSHPSRPVWITEGEKDADRLAQLGCTATTNVHGAGAWLPYYSEWLRGRDIVIVQDNDEKGARRTRTLINELEGVARRLRVLAFPELEVGGDVCDFLQQHPDYDRVDLIGRARDVHMEKSA